MNALVPQFPTEVLPIQLADAGPFSLTCVGEVEVTDPDLGAYPVQATLILGRFRSFAEAAACALRRGRPGSLATDRLAGFTPNLAVIQDRHSRLCLVGQIRPDGLTWCEPIQSDAAARSVMQEACRLRAKAMATLDDGNADVARALRFQAAALDGRLVDPAWRGRLTPAAALAA